MTIHEKFDLSAVTDRRERSKSMKSGLILVFSFVLVLFVVYQFVNLVLDFIYEVTTNGRDTRHARHDCLNRGRRI